MPATCGAQIMDRASASAQIFRFGLFEADSARNTLTRNGVRVKIQDQPFRVLILLLERPGEIVTRDELRQKLWPEGTFVDFDGSLNVILKKLRAAVGDDPENPRFIETVPRRGYRFIAPVSVEAPALAGRMKVEAVIPAEGGAGRGPAKTNTKTPSHRSMPRYLLAGVLTLAILAGLAWLAWRGTQNRLRSDSTRAQAAAIPVRKSIAVLGFRNLSGEPKDAWLATAFSEMLSTELATGEKLRLVSGEDVANLRTASPWPQTDTLGQETATRLGTALNSSLLVLGSYASTGPADRGQLRVDVRLQDAHTGEILTEVAEVGSSQDLFRLTSRVGARLRERLGVPDLAETDAAGVIASLPLDPVGARFYALGIAKLREFDSLAAKDLLQQASKADPKFSLVHAMLARAWGQLGYEQKRKAEAKKAFDLSADLPRVARMQVEGDYYESLGDHERAASVYRALFELLPDSVECGLQLAGTQVAAAHAHQALETIAQLRRLPPTASDDPRIDLMAAKTTTTKADSLALVRSALAKAEAQGKKLLYAQAKRDECMNLIYGDNPAQGPPACEDAYKIFIAAGNRLGAADAVRLMGDGQGGAGHAKQAMATYQRALTILQGLGEHEKTGAVLNNMAILFTNQGKLDRGEQLYRQAKAHFEQAGDKGNALTALSNIADILYLRGDLPSAEKLYLKGLEIAQSLDPSDPLYLFYRLADLELTQGRVAEAHRHAQQAIDSTPPGHASDQYLTGARLVLGATLEAEDDLQGARRQFQQALEVREKMGEMGAVGESQVELARLSLEEDHPEQAEALLRPAIGGFEKENTDPDAAGAYTLLSRVLLRQGKVEEARKALQLAAQHSRNSPDPALNLPIIIQSAHVETAATPNGSRGRQALANAQQQLRSAIASARKLGYYQIECDARLALGELELKTNPAQGRSRLTSLQQETQERGLSFLSHKARLLAEAGQPSLSRQ